MWRCSTSCTASSCASPTPTAASTSTRLGDSADQDLYVDEHGQLDFKASYEFSKQFSAFFQVQNINDEPLRFYSGDKLAAGRERDLLLEPAHGCEHHVLISSHRPWSTKSHPSGWLFFLHRLLLLDLAREDFAAAAVDQQFDLVPIGVVTLDFDHQVTQLDLLYGDALGNHLALDLARYSARDSTREPAASARLQDFRRPAGRRTGPIEKL